MDSAETRHDLIRSSTIDVVDPGIRFGSNWLSRVKQFPGMDNGVRSTSIQHGVWNSSTDWGRVPISSDLYVRET